MTGAAANAPPSTLNCMLNPGTAFTAGKVNAAAHVLPGGVIRGAVGNITTLIALLMPHEPGPPVPATVLPHATEST